MKTKPFLFLLLLPLAWSCSDDNDSLKPVVEVITPLQDSHFAPGETIDLHAIFSDNEELASFKIEIHFNPDGHVHKSGPATDKPFDYEITGDFDAGVKRYVKNHDIVIPVLIDGLPVRQGYYHLGVFCIDKSGNEQKVFVKIKIEVEIHG